MIRIALAEERRIIRWALREAFASIRDVEVVGEAENAADTLTMLRGTRPDVLVLDIQAPDLLPAIRDLEIETLVVVLAVDPEPIYGARAIAGGAHAYVGTAAGPGELLAAIRGVVRGERVIPPEIVALLADGDPTSALTKRELQVMELLARGMTNREIAEHLDIRTKTIDTHRAHVLKKLGLRNNSDLTRFAVKHGYVTV